MPRSLKKAILQSIRARLREGRKSPDATQLPNDAQCSRFLREYETFHAALRERDPDAWAELERERAGFDGSLMDGLQDE